MLSATGGLPASLKFHHENKPRLNTTLAAIATAPASQGPRRSGSNRKIIARSEYLDGRFLLGACACENRLKGVLRIGAGFAKIARYG